MTWLHLATCVLVYSSVLLIFSGHLIPNIFLRKFICRTSIWSSMSCVTVHSSLLYRNILPTYASSVLILILRVVLLVYIWACCMLYLPVVFFFLCLLLCSRGCQDICTFSSVLIHFFLYNIVLSFLCWCADYISVSLLWYLPPVSWCFVRYLLPSQCRLHIVDLLLWCLWFCSSCVLLHVDIYGLLQCCMNLVCCSCDLLFSFWFLVLQPGIGWIGLGSNSHLVALLCWYWFSLQ